MHFPVSSLRERVSHIQSLWYLYTPREREREGRSRETSQKGRFVEVNPEIGINLLISDTVNIPNKLFNLSKFTLINKIKTAISNLLQEI